MADRRLVSTRWWVALTIMLIVITLGIMAAMILRRGEEGSRMRELQVVQSAVFAMMADNTLDRIPSPLITSTNDMGIFPDATTPPEAKGLGEGDKPGYVLYAHDATPDGQALPTLNYISLPMTTWTYTVASDGTVHQGEKAPEPLKAAEERDE